MCDFHLKGQCFHPQKARKGTVAVSCQFRNCQECTNKTWQDEKIEEDIAYYQSIVELSQINTNPQAEQLQEQVPKKPFLTRIFSTP